MKRVKNLKSDGIECHGLLDKEKRLISIDTDTKFMEVTILHEFFHAVFKESALGETDIDSNLEEVIVEQFAKCINETFIIKPRRSK